MRLSEPIQLWALGEVSCPFQNLPTLNHDTTTLGTRIRSGRRKENWLHMGWTGFIDSLACSSSNIVGGRELDCNDGVLLGVGFAWAVWNMRCPREIGVCPWMIF